MRITVREWLDEWLQMREPMIRPRTAEQYRRLIRLHAAPLHAQKLAKVRPEEIEALLGQIWVSGKQRTAEQLFVLLRSAFKDALRFNRIKRNPMECVSRPRHKAETRTAYTPDEQRRLIDAARGSRVEIPLLLGLCCGLRRGEICGLRWSDVDLKNGILHIRQQIIRVDGVLTAAPPKSEAGRRDVPYTDALRPLLCARAQLVGQVCPYSPEGLQEALKRLSERASVPWLGVHGLRHTMATNAIRAGVSLRIVQNILGHASFTLTAAVYSHPDAEMVGNGVAAAWDCVV